MKIIKIYKYKNGTFIKLPDEICDRLKLQHADKVAIECKHDGFVVCKVENYQNWLNKLDSELIELDAYSRRILGSSLNKIKKMDVKNGN